jgi:hypothetical protein
VWGHTRGEGRGGEVVCVCCGVEEKRAKGVGCLGELGGMKGECEI